MLYPTLFASLAWGFMSYCLLTPGTTDRLRRLMIISAGFAAGAAGMVVLTVSRTGDFPFTLLRLVVAALFLALTGAAAGTLLAVPLTTPEGEPLFNRLTRREETFGACLFPFLMGAITAANLAATLRSAPLASITLIAIGGCFVANIAYCVATFVHRSPETTPLSLFLLKCSLVFFGASLSPRLDIFAPLSMKIMKFIHDFLHQFMESMLLPDHLFITSRLWNLIGLLFSKEVGFWGGLVLWFVPVLLASLAIVRLPLPTVAHVRQGALRRSMRAAALHRRRRLLIIPAIASLVLAWSVYHSLFPHTQFWDPAPVAVEASAAGEIDLPLKQGEIDLRDGRLHKFSYARGNSVVRFIVLNREDSLVVVLDACAICPPEGYGQGDGTVICHYCKTLIPLETVGLPGGCNPVPVTFTTDGASVRIPSLQLTNLWDSTVQTTQANAGKNR